jgi:hypothetical protein
MAFRSLEKGIICMILADSRVSFQFSQPRSLANWRRAVSVLDPTKASSFGLRVDIFKGGGVDRDRLVEQALELRGEDRVDVTLLDREIVGVFPIDLGLVGGFGDVLFLGLVLLLIGRVRAGLVLLEVANEFRVDTDGAGDDAHDVLGERSGLVGADDGGVGHRLTRTENTDEEFFCGHSLRGESEGESHREREAFRNSDDDQCYRDDQYACKGDALLTWSTMKTG